MTNYIISTVIISPIIITIPKIDPNIIFIINTNISIIITIVIRVLISVVIVIVINIVGRVDLQLALLSL